MYNLRNKNMNGKYSRQQHYSSGDMPDKNIKIILNRLPVLDNPLNHDSVFQVQNGKVMIKKNVTGHEEKRFLFKFCISLFIILICMMYYKDVYCPYGSHVAKTLILPNKLRNFNTYVINTLYTKWYQRFGIMQYSGVLETGKRPRRVKRRSEVCYNDFREFINESWFKEEAVEKMAERPPVTFIEEQCRIQKIVPKIADYFQYSFNMSDSTSDINSLIDYASYYRGARILSTTAKPYAEYKVQSGILQYITGLKYFIVDELSICRFSTTLCQHFVTGPSSILQPWNKPGDCWSFKGTYGGVQIELSERIYITAVSLEHIPVNFVSSGKMRSAPARFSIIGIEDSRSHKFTWRNHLGTYRYLLSEPNVQTFSISKEETSHPYKIIEFNVESNHGNENYTCVYRLRVHGRPINSL